VARIPTWKFPERLDRARYLSKRPPLFSPLLPEESRMCAASEGNKGDGGSSRERRTMARRGGGEEGRDKCRLLFEKPHALAPARHVAGARVCVRAFAVSSCSLCRNGRGCSGHSPAGFYESSSVRGVPLSLSLSLSLSLGLTCRIPSPLEPRHIQSPSAPFCGASPAEVLMIPH